MAWFWISSRSVGVSYSQQRNMKQVTLCKREVIKQHFQYNFTGYSQFVNEKH